MLPGDEPSEGLGEPIDELFRGFGVEVREPFSFNDEPESFDGVEIR